MTPELQAAVEKVARALESVPSGMHHTEWRRVVGLAAIRAVAEATKEPDAAMIEARYSVSSSGPDDDWRAMHAASILGEALRDE